LFSSLEAELGSLTGLRVLDLYAGSGAIGLEAMSRGAGVVTSVESNRRTAKLVQDNATMLGFRKLEVVVQPVVRALAHHPRAPYDVVFLDPPYPVDNDEVERAVALLVAHEWLATGFVLVVERSARSGEPAWPAGLVRERERAYGETVLWYVRADPHTTSQGDPR
jgi:16S rRNA (guanine966-N2)-methyltransferase